MTEWTTDVAVVESGSDFPEACCCNSHGGDGCNSMFHY